MSSVVFFKTFYSCSNQRCLHIGHSRLRFFFFVRVIIYTLQIIYLFTWRILNYVKMNWLFVVLMRHFYSCSYSFIVVVIKDAFILGHSRLRFFFFVRVIIYTLQIIYLFTWRILNYVKMNWLFVVLMRHSLYSKIL